MRVGDRFFNPLSNGEYWDVEKQVSMAKLPEGEVVVLKKGGKLTVNLHDLAVQTKVLGERYYKVGEKYKYKGKVYTLEKAGAYYEFCSDDGGSMSCAIIGTMVPGIASAGMECERVGGLQSIGAF